MKDIQYSSSRLYSDQAAVAANQNIKEKNYWLSTLGGGVTKSHFPFDQRGEGDESRSEIEIASETFQFTPELSRLANQVSSGIDHKLHMILVAGLVALLDKYTDSRDICIGSPILKQEREAEFINTLLIFKIWVSPELTFKELLLYVKETVISATKHQNFPMEVLPEFLKLPVPINRLEFPLFDTALLLENIHDRGYLKGIQCQMLFSIRRNEAIIEGKVEYNSSRYHISTVKRIIAHYNTILELGLRDLTRRLSTIDVLSQDERNRLLLEFNDNKVNFAQDKLYNESFVIQVEKTPGRIALVGNTNKNKETVQLTYNYLNSTAAQWAQVLRDNGVDTDTIVGIMVDRCVEMIIAAFAVMKAGGAYLPIDPGYPEARIEYILNDSCARLLLTGNSNGIKSWGSNSQVQGLKTQQVEKRYTLLNFENFSVDSKLEFDIPTSKLHLSNLVYVIYTSGSSGKPKGVAVEQKNLIAYLNAFFNEFEISDKDTVLQQASFSFDVFVEEVYPVLLKGGKLVLPEREVILNIPSLLLYISRHCISLISVSPLLLNELNKYEDITCINTFISGGDVLKPEYVGNLIKKGCVYNTYGPTESTVCATYYRYWEQAGQEIVHVPIGKPIANYQVYVLDNGRRLLPVGVPGELCVSGPGVTRGYLNRPELTSDKYIKINPFLEDPERGFLKKTALTPQVNSLYRTGDLVRWKSDGNLEFLGRMDSQVKIRGYRIELGEIENKLLEHPDINGAVVVQKKDDTGDPYLCGYFLSEKSLEASELRDYLGKKLPDYMVPWFFVSMERLPITANGKIDHKALPDPDTMLDVQYVPPRSEREKILVDIWSEVLGKGLENSEPDQSQSLIGIDHRFFDLGGNSLKAIMMMAKIHQAFNVKVLLADIFTIQTIRGLSDFIGQSVEEEFISIEKAEDKDYYYLSSAQERLYVLHQLDPMSKGYNMSQAVPINEVLDRENLENIIKQLVFRHEGLRTSFEIIEGNPMQKVHPYMNVDIEYYDWTSLNQSKNNEPEHSSIDYSEVIGFITNRFVRPFDLSVGPLFRIGVIETGPAEYILLLDIHHIISDAVSLGILTNEFLALNQGKILSSLRLQYKDYSEWQRKLWKQTDVKDSYKQQEEYWLKQFDGPLPELNLLYDGNQSDTTNVEMNNEGEVVQLALAKEKSDALRKIASDSGATLQIVTASIFYILLAKISGQEDIIIGTSVVGRRHADLENIIGVFINTLALRNFPSAHKTFNVFLNEVKEKSLKAYENQEYPFEELIKRLPVSRGMDRNPLFNVMYEIQPGTKTLEPMQKNRTEGKRIAKFDLDWLGFDDGSDLYFNITYRCHRFKRETVEFMAECFLVLIDDVISHPGYPIKEFKYSPHESNNETTEDVEFDF